MKNVLSICALAVLLTACGGEPKTFSEKFEDMGGLFVVKCQTAIKKRAMYSPSSTKFDILGTEELFFIDHIYSKDEYPNHPHRFIATIPVEMSNGYGAMVPKTASCYINTNTSLSEFKIVELEIV
jgi:hypothetical protein